MVEMNEAITVIHHGRVCKAFVVSVYADGFRYRVQRFEVRGINDERENVITGDWEGVEWARGHDEETGIALRAAHALAPGGPRETLFKGPDGQWR